MATQQTETAIVDASAAGVAAESVALTTGREDAARRSGRQTDTAAPSSLLAAVALHQSNAADTH